MDRSDEQLVAELIYHDLAEYYALKFGYLYARQQAQRRALAWLDLDNDPEIGECLGPAEW